MDHRVRLASLSPHEAVADALHRAVAGIDSGDVALWESSCLHSPDTSFGAGERIMQGWEGLNAYIREKIFPLTTTHFITNIRVDLEDGADTAFMTASAIAYHIKPEDAFSQELKSFTTAGQYFIDVAKDSSDGLWKIKNWKLKIAWTSGDRSALAG